MVPHRFHTKGKPGDNDNDLRFFLNPRFEGVEEVYIQMVHLPNLPLCPMVLLFLVIEAIAASGARNISSSSPLTKTPLPLTAACSWSWSQTRTRSWSWTIAGPDPWSQSQSHHISDPGFGPGPVIFLVPAHSASTAIFFNQ